jgi:hypothetical protein
VTAPRAVRQALSTRLLLLLLLLLLLCELQVQLQPDALSFQLLVLLQQLLGL